MKAQTLRSALDGHGWLGIFISVPLFIIFWAGSLTLFYPELKKWAELPQFPVDATQAVLPVDQVLRQTLAQYQVDHSQTLFLVLPDENQPWYQFYLPQLATENDVKPDMLELLVHPVSGEVVTTAEQFHFADFLYKLHIDLQLPAGDYIVGIITLLFMVIIFTGVVVQFKKLFSHFFLYRADKTPRYQLTDIHNVIGVISLPYSFIFALTGLMFNLGLISQLVTLTLVYDGDRQRLLADAGFARVVAQPSGQVQQMPDLDQLIADWEQQQNADAHSVRLNHYGDKNALIRLIGQHNDNFAQRIDMTYRVRDGQFPPEINPAQRNAFADGTRFLYALHFGHFAGVDLRIIYSLLGLGVCAIIVAGNMLWLNKYSKKRDISPRVCRLLQATTLGGCIGIVLATGVGFLLERTLAPAWLGRTPVIETAFAITLLLSMLAAWCSHRAKHFVRQGMLVCALLLLLTVAGDVLMFGPQLLQLAQTGSAEVLAVSCSFALLAMLLLWLASRFRLTASQQPEYQYQQ
ncbi:MAG: PepSY domain-containing protein [Gammaproteobacteria bacterium]|nr:PepSY domain-containing protein [Gammaproteobacteria bacterium]MBU2185261.1 PepSY domain-containing protein [Gammaproteobacteria bacterium]MBU2205052.1 PepSY domain-containing protein [Gammaproteobacteria bacterium]